MLHHINIDDNAVTSPQWFEPVQHVRGTLQTAITMFYTTIGMLNHHIDFGSGMSTALSAFAQEYKQLVEGE
jgi:hypothetical protein